MAGLKILSVAVGKPDIYDSMWRRIFSIAEGLRSQRNEVELVSYAGRRNFGNFAQSFKVPCHFIHAEMINVFHKNVNLFDKYRPDLVLANTHIPAFISATSKFKRIPLIFDMHGVAVAEIKMLAKERGFSWGYRQLLLNLPLERLAVLSSDKISCVSHSMIQYLNRIQRIPLSKLEYVTNGVDLDFFKQCLPYEAFMLRKKLGVENKLVFGYIGSLQKWQGVERFIEATRLVKDKKMSFLIVGGITERINGNLIQLKTVPREKLLYYYSACDVLVLPRPRHIVTEVAAPTKFAEYTAMGKPVLITNVGDAAILARKYKCGIVISDNSPENLKDGFLAFNELSDSEFRRMGENSRRLAEAEFDWNKIMAGLDSTISRLVVER